MTVSAPAKGILANFLKTFFYVYFMAFVNRANTKFIWNNKLVIDVLASFSLGFFAVQQFLTVTRPTYATWLVGLIVWILVAHLGLFTGDEETTIEQL
ncbi:MAG: hypothetical protein IH840_00680 [Candidatus Heimdallarchaeota archaeon]|nr:hypothetical protein [Candidatus Heimdallarchaeota archaeon]